VNEIATSAKPFIDQIPKKDRQAIQDLECVFNAKVKISWTNEGWHYEVKFL